MNFRTSMGGPCRPSARQLLALSIPLFSMTKTGVLVFAQKSSVPNTPHRVADPARSSTVARTRGGSSKAQKQHGGKMKNQNGMNNKKQDFATPFLKKILVQGAEGFGNHPQDFVIDQLDGAVTTEESSAEVQSTATSTSSEDGNQAPEQAGAWSKLMQEGSSSDSAAALEQKQGEASKADAAASMKMGPEQQAAGAAPAAGDKLQLEGAAGEQKDASAEDEDSESEDEEQPEQQDPGTRPPEMHSMYSPGLMMRLEFWV